MGVLSIFILYQDDVEEEGIDEMDQPPQDLPPSPLNDPHEEFQDQPRRRIARAYKANPQGKATK